jgi:osmotically-inducible protein OsmY
MSNFEQLDSVVDTSALVVDTSADRRDWSEKLSTALLALLSFLWAAASLAQQTAAPSNVLSEITVTGKKISSDEEVSTQVASALHSDPYVDDGHVTVTTKDGIVTLHGFVQDAWDLLALRRIAKKVAGGRRIVNDVELVLNDQ